MQPVDVHGLLGLGIRARREQLELRQEDAAQLFRSSGLPAWRRSTVAQVEAGTRRPSLGDLLLVAVALGCSLADLVPADVSEPIDLGTGATMDAAGVKRLLSGDWEGYSELPADGGLHAPGDELLHLAWQRAQADRERIGPLLQPIWDGAGRQVLRGDVRRSYLPPTEAEQRAADRLGILPQQLKAAVRVLYSRDFEEERDARVQQNHSPAQSLQGRRGHATRALLGEIKRYLVQCGVLLEDEKGLPNG